MRKGLKSFLTPCDGPYCTGDAESRNIPTGNRRLVARRIPCMIIKICSKIIPERLQCTKSGLHVFFVFVLFWSLFWSYPIGLGLTVHAPLHPGVLRPHVRKIITSVRVQLQQVGDKSGHTPGGYRPARWPFHWRSEWYITAHY